MAQLEVLILELVAVDRLSAGTVTLGEVTTLNHEVLDDTVESGVLVAEALLAGGQSPEEMVSMEQTYSGSMIMLIVPEVLCSLMKEKHVNLVY